MVFSAEEFLEVATESWSEWDLNPQSLNSIHILELTEISGYIYIYIYIYIHNANIYIYYPSGC